MFAIVKTGGKQIKVSVDHKVSVEKIEAKIGDKVVLNEVLMICDGEKISLGSPFVANAAVTATVEGQERTKKIIVFKKKRRQNYRRKNGHRQHQTVLRILEIGVGGKALKAETVAKPAPAAEKAATEAGPKAETKAVEKVAEKKTTTAKPVKTVAAKTDTKSEKA
jgi:large subunit ribosomal protein L21